ncbi:ABC transporter permease [Candidatus Bipolaricaulota bacterium]|nr:ABC transporter permease [Candidatus Bipolaricaulota bacterium]
MFAYTVRRLAQMVVVLFGLTILIFTMLKAMPGDPAKVMAGLGARPETIAAIRLKLGLDEPIPVQYWKFVTGLLNGQLQAMTFHKSVWAVIIERLPATVELGVFALIIALLVSIPAGILSAVYRNSPLDYAVTTIALIGISVPVFWLALMLMLVFGVILKVLPVSGRGDTLWGWSFLTLDGLRHLVIPAVALASVQMALNARLTRASMLEVMRQEYVKSARAKGLREWVVMGRHAFRNAMLPVVTNVGIQVGALFAGAVLTETTTAWPGIGRLMVESIARLDQAVVFGLTLFMGTCFMVSYLVVDLLYAYIDPRITYD